MPKNILFDRTLKPLAKLIYVFILTCNKEGIPASKSQILSSLSICEESYLKHIKTLLEKGFILRDGGKFSETTFTAQGFSEYGNTEYAQGFSGCEKEKRTKKEKFNKSYIYINSSSSAEKSPCEEEDLALKETLKGLSDIVASFNAKPYEKAFAYALKSLFRNPGFSISKEQLTYCVEKFMSLKPAATNLVAYLIRFIENSMLEADLYAEKLRKEIEAENARLEKQQREKETLIEGELKNVLDDFCDKEYPGFSQIKTELSHKYVQKISMRLRGDDVSDISLEIDTLSRQCEDIREKTKLKYPIEILRKEAAVRLNF